MRKTPASLATHIAFKCERGKCREHNRSRMHRVARSEPLPLFRRDRGEAQSGARDVTGADSVGEVAS